ncbi:Predicted N-acyltransferase, GNAT family [Pseudomonas extremaustralis]|jgi:predicted GNAT family N-acyltransferase|nr:Acetyltransferase [Pseudomonas extremaustralis]SKA89504.1 Predicted N-acyltransferase, GNAT family [Pseudomonas extremaustralis]
MAATCYASWSSKEAWGLPMNKIHVRVADWQKDIAEIRRIREAVFIAEQSVPPELEWDADDADAVHFLAYEGDFPIGTARLLPSGEIGRVSVLKDWRGLKVGDKLMEAVIGEAEKRGQTRQFLSAQVYAAPFYERLGFKIVSEEFLEVGIPHVDMVREG